MRVAILVASLMLPLPALAEGKPLTGEEFDALTRGKIMDTYSGGQLYGIEKFFSGGRSIWQDANGCKYGSWKQEGQLICFYYEDNPTSPDCWTYFDEGNGLSAYYNGDPASEPIFLKPTTAPMTCNEYLGV